MTAPRRRPAAMPRPREAVVLGRWEIEIPGYHPPRLNELIGRSWHAVHRRKRSDKALVAAYLALAGVPPATGRRRLRIAIVLGPRQRGGDPDSFFKVLVDSIVAAGALRDDNRQWVELMPVEFERGVRKATRITLEDI